MWMASKLVICGGNALTVVWTAAAKVLANRARSSQLDHVVRLVLPECGSLLQSCQRENSYVAELSSVRNRSVQVSNDGLNRRNQHDTFVSAAGVSDGPPGRDATVGLRHRHRSYDRG